jgi:type IV pilus assembly protein PilV
MINMTNRKKESGFSLIEILITLIIMAIGLLSVATLQFKGLKYNGEAQIRNNYNVLAYDIIDRMRNNKDAANGYDAYLGNYTIPVVWAPADVCNEALAPPTAANDLICWHQQLFNHLPPGSTANITSAADFEHTKYSITLTWSDTEDGSAPKTVIHVLANPT